ncbi:MAG: hypothetical protein ACWGPR_08530 [Candidatus Deferrimicrobiaceae bacterium]
MPSIQHWQEASQSWDTLGLGDSVLPGVWEVQATASTNLDVKAKRGADGASIRDRGVDPVRFRMEGQVLATDGQWPALVTLMATIQPTRGKGLGPLPISHPVAQLYKVSQIVIEVVEGPEIRNGIGIFHIDALEWIPKPKKKRAPTTNTSDPAFQATWQHYSLHSPSPFVAYQPPSVETDLDFLIADQTGDPIGTVPIP